MDTLFRTPQRYRFRNNLVFGVSGGADSHDASGKSHGQSSGPSGGTGHGGGEQDTMGGMTVTGTRPSKHKSPGDGGEGGYMGMTTADLADKFSLNSKDTRSVPEKVQDFVTKMLVHGLTQNVIAKNLQKAADLAGLDVDIEGSVAKALTDVREKNPDISEEAATSKALTNAVTSTVTSMQKKDPQRGGERIANWLSSGVGDSYKEARIDPSTGESTAPAQGSWADYTEQYFGTPEGTQSMQEMLQGQADFMKQQTEEWQTGVGEATEKQTGLLDDLIDQSQTGTGMFSPVKFKLAGRDVDFVPRAKREQATQLAGFGQQGLANQTGYLDNVLKNAPVRSPEAGGLAYLDSLKDMTKMGEGFSLAREGMASGEKMQREAGEPGVLDYIKAVGSLF